MSLVEELRKIPPVTRFLCGSLISVTVPMMLQVVSPYKLLFVREYVTRRYEVSETTVLHVSETPQPEFHTYVRAGLRLGWGVDSHIDLSLKPDMAGIHDLLYWWYV